MKVQDIRKKTSKCDAFSTLTPLNYVLKIFGLSCIYRDGTRLAYKSPICKFVLYIIVFFTANAYSVYYNLQNHEFSNKFTFADSLHFVYLLGYIQYIFDMIIVYKYGRQVNVDYYNLYDYIDGILGTPHYKEIKRCINTMCLFYICIGVMTIIIEFSTLSIHSNWSVINMYSVEIIYIAIRMISALDIIANCVQVKFRLQTIGDILEFHSYHADYNPGVVKDFIYEKAWISQDVSKVNVIDPLTISSNRQDILRHLSRCYTLLIEQSNFINTKFGVRTIFTCSLYILDMVLLLNTIIRICMGILVIYNAPGYLIVLSSVSRVVTYTVILCCGLHRCEQTYRQIERILRLIDHLLIGKKISNETRETLTELKNLIASRPVDYHACNFFKVKYGTLVSMLSVIVTYTIILLQNLQ